MDHASDGIWALALSAAVGIPALVAWVVHLGAKDTGADGRVGLKVAGVAVVWVVASSALTYFGAYGEGARHAGPWFALAVGGALAGALLGSRSRAVRSAMGAPRTLSRLAWPHTFRIEGVVFLLLWAQGHLPAVFALPAGIGDIAIGLSAPFVARRLTRRADVAGAARFNILGVADLVVALSVAFLAGLGPLRVFHQAASTLPLASLPLSLIPTVAVPVAIALHLVSLARLRCELPRWRRQASLIPAADPTAA